MRRLDLSDSSQGRRISTFAFWLVVALCAVGATLWIHGEDTGHGDVWDWLDWLEGALASVAASFLVVGTVWASTMVAIRRLETRRVRRAMKRSAEAQRQSVGS
jgi:hypothetical protein